MGERPFKKPKKGGKALEDCKIIELFFERNEEAVSACKEKYGAYCLTIARNVLQNEEDAEECLSSACLALWNTIPPNSPEKLGAYIGRITHNIAINRFRKNVRKKRGGGEAEAAFSELEECIPEKNGVEEEIERAEITSVIEKFLYSNPPEKRNIFIRRYWYMYPVAEIAKAYGISESKTKSVLFRMRKELKKYLEKEGLF